MRIRSFALAAVLLAAPLTASAQTPVAGFTASAAPNDYAKAEAWLCRPGHKDACSQDQAATVVAANGKLTTEAYRAASNPPIDCFYVYPTVSNDKTANSDMIPGNEEQRVIEQQFARFGAVCRQYAPMYRQVTLTALRAVMLGKPMPGVDRELGYHDVLDAWRYYLAHDNKGRGFVLIGHSQGSGVLGRLLKEEIDGKPIENQMLSAILAGTRLPSSSSPAPLALRATPPCKFSRQLGCVIAFASFRVNSPPPSNSRFGKVEGTGEPAVCVNPAALGGGSGALDAYLSTRVAIAESAAAPKPWVKDGPPITTPFVKVPGLLTAECVEQNGFGYLAVTVHGDPADPRVDDISGDVVTGGVILKDWGLHLIDMNLTMGNLIGIVGDETKTYLARK